MGKQHGARQQRKIAKQKAKRAEKRSTLSRRTSKDPTLRLQQAAKWPVVHALASANLWEDGIGYLALARRESEEGLVVAVFLVDVFCLGVKNAFWRAGTEADFRQLIERMEESHTMRAIPPACLVKIVRGAVDFAQSLGFSPHPDYRHAAMVLDGLDATACDQEFTFGKDGQPLYIRGPNETLEQAKAITERVLAAGGHFIVGGSVARVTKLVGIEDESEEYDALDAPDEDDRPDELGEGTGM